MVDCLVCSNLFSKANKELNEVKNHINKLNADISLQNLLYKWFDSLFVDGCSFLNFYIIWDAMMLDGNIVLFRAAIAILEELKDQILKLKDFNEINEFLEIKIPEENFNSETFMSKLLDKHYCNFDINDIWELREKCYKEVYDSINKTKKIEFKSKENDNKKICNLNWPFCVENVNDLYIQKVEILKTKYFDNKIIDYDFFNDNVEEKIIKNKNKIEEENKRENNKDLDEKDINDNNYKIYNDLLIQRDIHKCKNNVQNSNDFSKEIIQSSIIHKGVNVNFITGILGDLDLKLQNSLNNYQFKEKDKDDDEK